MPPNDKFDVYVEGVRDPSPQGITRAAQALAPKLSMPAERVAKLLSGRFRVRTSVDEDMGRKLVRDLETFGLRVVIVPQGAKPGAPQPPPARAVAATQPAPRPLPAALAPSDAEDSVSIGALDLGPPPPSPAPTATKPAPAPSFMPSSFGPPPEDDGIQLADLNESAAPAAPTGGGSFMPSSFGPSADEAPLEIDKPAPRAAAPAPRPAAVTDPFAPPAEAEEHSLDLAVEKPKPRGTTVPPSAPSAANQSQPRMRPVARPAEPRTDKKALAGAIAVLVVALGVGYFPAMLYAKHVDDTKVVQLQKEYRQLEVNPWKGEATHRTKSKVQAEIDDVRWNATLLMMGIWAATAGLLAALAYVLL